MYSVNFDEEKKKGEYESGTPLSGSAPVGSSDGDSNPAGSGAGEKFKWDGTWGTSSPLRTNGMWSEPFDAEKSEARFKKSFADYMVPKDTPFRRRSQFALSKSALDDAVNDYYENVLRPGFLAKREASKRRGRDEYRRYAGVVGGDPVHAMHMSMKADDPVAVIDSAMGDIDDEALRRSVAPLAAYGGYDVNEYIEKFVKPSLRDRMINEYVEENKPRSSAEYILRSALGNSLVGKMSTMALDSRLGGSAHLALSNEGLGHYDSSRLEDFASGVGSLVVDMPVFSGIGGGYGALLGRGVKWATNRAASQIMAKSTGRYMTEKYAKKIAERAIVNNLGTKIMQGSLGQGLTLGTYDVANSVADDILYGEGVDFGKAAGAFTRGFVTGGAAGAAGVPLRHASAGLTGGKKLLSSAGVLSAESAVFTTAGEFEKVLQGVEIEPIDLLYDYAESTATLLTMKMAHWKPSGAGFKLGSNGKIKDEYALTEVEKRELRALNIDPEEFMLAVEMELKLPSFGGENAENIKKQYATLMSSEGLSASTRSKLLFLVENKLTSTPPVPFDYKANRGEDGRWYVETFDEGGRAIEKNYFRDSESARSFLIMERGNIRRNRIAAFEKELTDGFNSQNFLRQAGLYAKEKGIDVDMLSEVLYKKANGEALEPAEEGIVKEILERTAYDGAGMVQFLHDGRVAIEKKYNLPEGSLLSVIDKKFFMCTAMQNKALDEYELFVRSEVERLKKGTSPAVARAMAGRGATSDYAGMSNDEVKRRELERYENWIREQEAERANGQPLQPTSEGIADASKKKWSPELVDELKQHIPRLSKLLHYDINIIARPEDLQLPDPKDNYAIRDYNTQLDAHGWYKDNKVHINLMNIKSVEELERTVAHEIVGHAGLERIFGNYYNEFLEEVYKKADKFVRDEINKQKAANPLYDTSRLTEEYLAGLSEKAFLNSRERSLMRKFKDFVKNMLIRLNIYSGNNRSIGEQELMDIIRRHCNYVLKGKETSLHRRRVFGNFDAARRGEGGYSDRSLYDADVRSRIHNGTYFRGTPEGFLNQKLETGYYTLPKDERWMLSELIKRRRAENEKKREDVRYRYIGERGAENFDALGKETLMPALENAKKYEKSGYSPFEIKRQTGWERGADGMWRYEMFEKDGFVKDVIRERYFADSPEKMKLYLENKDLPRHSWSKEFENMWEDATKDVSGKGYRLSDIVNDDALFDTYPDFAYMPVRIVSNSSLPVLYDGKRRELIVDRRLFLMKDSGAQLAGAIQNMIQDYENFSKAVPFGVHLGDVESKREYLTAKKMVGDIKKLRMLSPGFDGGNEFDLAFRHKYGAGLEDFDKVFPSYDEFLLFKKTGNNFAFSGNVEADNVRRRYGMGKYERLYTPAGSSETFPRDRQMVVRNLDDLDKYLTGPLDIIKQQLQLSFPGGNYGVSGEMLGEAPSLYNQSPQWYRQGTEPYGKYNLERVYDDETGEFTNVRKRYEDYLKGLPVVDDEFIPEEPNERIKRKPGTPFNYDHRFYKIYDDETGEFFDWRERYKKELRKLGIGDDIPEN